MKNEHHTNLTQQCQACKFKTTWVQKPTGVLVESRSSRFIKMQYMKNTLGNTFIVWCLSEKACFRFLLFIFGLSQARSGTLVAGVGLEQWHSVWTQQWAEGLSEVSLKLAFPWLKPPPALKAPVWSFFFFFEERPVFKRGRLTARLVFGSLSEGLL